MLSGDLANRLDDLALDLGAASADEPLNKDTCGPLMLKAADLYREMATFCARTGVHVIMHRGGAALQAEACIRDLFGEAPLELTPQMAFCGQSR
jgi:hypothetical protein